MSEIRRARRYYLLQRLAAYNLGDSGLEAAWRGKQEEQNIKADGVTAVSPLPDGFPSKTALEAGGYYVVEDIDGASTDELRRNAGLNERQAQAAIDAAAALI